MDHSKKTPEPQNHEQRVRQILEMTATMPENMVAVIISSLSRRLVNTKINVQAGTSGLDWSALIEEHREDKILALKAIRALLGNLKKAKQCLDIWRHYND